MIIIPHFQLITLRNKLATLTKANKEANFNLAGMLILVLIRPFFKSLSLVVRSLGVRSLSWSLWVRSLSLSWSLWS